MRELRDLLNITNALSPVYQYENLIVLRCYCDFEGHGRASETWEEHWVLELPHIQDYWRSTSGDYLRRSSGVGAYFHGRSVDQVIQRAKAFVTDLKALGLLEWIKPQ